MEAVEGHTNVTSAKASDFFPSRFLKADDLAGEEREVTIARWGKEEFNDEEQAKLVLYFTCDKRGLVINKTNMRLLVAMFGDSLDGWIGKKVLLSAEPVNFQGRVVNSIRVRKSVAVRGAAAN